LRANSTTDRRPSRPARACRATTPSAILARLAVDHPHRNRGVGATLLHDALRRATLASEQLAIRAVVVHATDESAPQFYEHFGFRALSATPRTLIVTLAELRAAGYP